MRAWNILVVDDDIQNRDIIAEWLDESHFNLEMAENGLDAWGKLQNLDQTFDLILLDRMMPLMNGMELLTKIKEDSRFIHIAVVMQTAASTPEQIREGLEAGCYYYLTKPYKGLTLISIVNAALEDLRSKELLRNAVSQPIPLPEADNAEYHFATLEEAQRLATLLSVHCPNPEIVAMGLSELLINAIEHGNLGISYAEKSSLKTNGDWEQEVSKRLQLPQNTGKKAVIRFTRTDENLEFTIVDQGNGFDWKKYLDFDPERAFDPNGRGIAMAGKLAFTKIEYRGKGNHVVVSISLP